VAEGKLRVTTNKALVLEYTSKKGKPVSAQIPQGELSADLEQLRRDFRTIQQLDGVEVEFDQEGSAVKRIRRKGQAFVPPSASSTRPQAASSARPMVGTSGSTGRQPQLTPGQTSKTTVQRAFHNPYNFIPAPPRKTNDPDLGDHEPVGHHRLFPDRYTGVIRVKMTAITPLLLPDAANATDIGNGHKSFPVRLDADGKPYIPPTSLKGMLRSAYEAITNSRLAVFPGHEASGSRDATGHGARLAFRRPARIEVVPARVEECEEDRVVIRLLSQLWLKSAAKLPRYEQRPQRNDRRKGESRAALRYPDNSLPENGDHVLVRVEGNGRVSEIKRYTERTVPQGYYEGWVLITEPNINTKRYERVFVVTDKDRSLVLTNEEAQRVRRLWTELIENYQQTHVKDLEQRRARGEKPTDYLGNEPGRTAWSRHIWDKEYLKLKPGTLCYVRLENNSRISGIYPVTISRDLYSVSPLSLVPPSLRPATQIKELSPADRVFGWVNQEGKGAYRGHLRIGPVTCQTSPENAIEWFNKQKRNLYGEEARREPGLPLAILGQPKPQQARFYVAASPDGEAQKDGLDKEKAGYSSGKGLRGRKVYPHHKLPERYWDNPMVDRTQQAMDGKYFQEYRRPRLNGQEQRDDQNRSIQGWVKPGTEFTFDIHITNLSKVELGALLWLLSLPKEHYHRFGGGKPLGFGSVYLEIDWTNTKVGNGAAWKNAYENMDDTLNDVLSDQSAGGIIQTFQDAVKRVYGQNKAFDEVPFIKAFLRMAKGFDDSLPVHYPRSQREPNPEGLAYEWFVENERVQQGRIQHGYALPNLSEDTGLPILERGERR
jgi:CRISPR-associated protein (TIGR03986 family)